MDTQYIVSAFQRFLEDYDAVERLLAGLATQKTSFFHTGPPQFKFESGVATIIPAKLIFYNQFDYDNYKNCEYVRKGVLIVEKVSSRFVDL